MKNTKAMTSMAMMVATTAMAAAFVICANAHQSTARRVRSSVSNGCSTPSLTLNGSRVVPRQNSTPDYSTLGEIKFTARMPSPFVPGKTQHRLCKIKCVAGQWVGPLCKIEENNTEDGRFHPVLRSCKLHLNGTDLVLAHDGVLLKQWNGRIPDRSKIKLRCDGAPGLFKLHGDPNLLCSDGDWNRELPSCLPTTSMFNYSEYSPPTIRVRLAFGDSAVDYRNNHIVIYPGSIVHLECLFRRHYGDVQWTWRTTQQQRRNHLTGWSIAVDERELIYRMSLYYAKSELDSGDYTCITPKNQNNTVTLKVEAVQCEKRNQHGQKLNSVLIAKTRGNHVGQTIDYECSLGFLLIGSNQSSCLADGRWSSNVPHCEQISCPSVTSLIIDDRLSASSNNNSYGSKISFQCDWGYALKGASEINCKIDGRWSSSIPKCIDILCSPPSIPDHGYLLEKSYGATYRAGTAIQFACEKPYRVVGEQSIVCEENGMWSSPAPSCRLACEYPTKPTKGRLIPPKFWYEAGDVLKVVCDTGYVINEPESEIEFVFVSCAENGTWSRDIPRCVNYTRATIAT